MKKVFLPAKTFLLIIMGLAGAIAADAQRDNTAEIKNMVEGQRYLFVAQSAMPMSGRIRQLTPDYDFKVTKDTVVSYLPYFGQAYVAPMDPTQGGIQFTSTSFDYTATPRKKGGWNISIKPKDYGDVQQIMLSISESGYATLQVNNTNRQAISFNGYITAIKEKRKK